MEKKNDRGDDQKVLGRRRERGQFEMGTQTGRIPQEERNDRGRIARNTEQIQ